MRVLHACPPDEFVATRARLVRELRASGKKNEAAAVAKLPKPTAPAWALNQLARSEPKALAGLFAQRRDAESAQANGDVDALRDRAASYRQALAELVQVAGGFLAESGRAAPPLQLRKLRATLEAAARDPSHVGALLLRGALDHEIEAEDGSETLTAAPPPPLRVVGGSRSGRSHRTRAPVAEATQHEKEVKPPAPIRPRTDDAERQLRALLPHLETELREAQAAETHAATSLAAATKERERTEAERDRVLRALAALES